jgi:hypothetical protein
MLIAAAVALLGIAAARRMTEEDMDLLEQLEQEEQLEQQEQLEQLEEERQRPLCFCINPFRNTPSEYLGVPAANCAATNRCYVPCDADCRDLELARGEGRCTSALACQPRLLAFAPGRPRPGPGGPRLASLPSASA